MRLKTLAGLVLSTLVFLACVGAGVVIGLCWNAYYSTDTPTTASVAIVQKDQSILEKKE